MGIRTKIMLGFMILASMLFISGAISIFELTKLGRAVKGLIQDNYRSIDYSRNMLNALEMQEKALLLYASSESDSAQILFAQAEVDFYSNLDSARQNFTTKEEMALVDSVALSYSNFLNATRTVKSGSNFSINDYLSTIKPLTSKTSERVKDLITINQEGLFSSAAFLETSAQRASIPGLIVIITSLIFTFVFTYLVHHYFVSPIIRLTKGINDFVKYKKPFDVHLEAKDELMSLRESIINLIAILKTTSRKAEL
jgi:hypothetical protein